jgi:hypothetical protein
MHSRGTPLAPSWPEVQQCPILGQEAQAISMKNALVPLAPQVDGPATAQFCPAARPNRAKPNHAKPHRAKADFVAHLIAMAVQAPQTRARRRAEPQQASAAYRSLVQWPSEPGGALSRSL